MSRMVPDSAARASRRSAMGRYQGRTRKAALRKNRRKRSVVEVSLAFPTGSRLAMRARWTDWPR